MKSIAIVKRRGVPRNLSKFYVDGGTLNLIETIECFKKNYFKVFIFTTNEDRGSNLEYFDNIQIIRLNMALSRNMNDMSHDLNDGLLFSKKLLQCDVFINNTFDFYYTHHWSSALPPLLEESNPNSIHIHIPHLLAVEKLKFIDKDIPSCIIKYEKKILTHANKIVAVSYLEKENIKSSYKISDEKIFVIPNGITSPYKISNNEKSKDKAVTNIVSVGRISRQKGFVILIKAIRKLINKGFSINCSIIGGEYRGEEEYIKELNNIVDKYNLNSSINFTGMVDHNGVCQLINDSDIYVQASLYESQGIALLEAMSLGVAVISSNIDVVKEYIVDGYNGLLFQSGNCIHLADTIERLIKEPKLLENLGNEAKNVSSKYSWDKTRELLLKCFNGGVNQTV